MSSAMGFCALWPLLCCFIFCCGLGVFAVSLGDWTSLCATSFFGFVMIYVGSGTMLDASRINWTALAAMRQPVRLSVGDAKLAGRKLRWRLASKVASIVHASSLLIIAIWSLRRSAAEGLPIVASFRPLLQRAAALLTGGGAAAAPDSDVHADFAAAYTAPNADREIALLCFTIGYFVVDTLHMVVWRVHDIPIVIHHVVVLCYAALTLYIGRGGLSAALATVLGEATNPLQGVLWISLRLRLKRVVAVASPLFTAAFIVARCIVSPILCAPLIWTFTHDPRPAFVFFGYACAAINLGGILWAIPLVQHCCKLRAQVSSDAGTSGGLGEKQR
mgnify:FL=1